MAAIIVAAAMVACGPPIRRVDEDQQQMTRMQEEAFRNCLHRFLKDVGRFPSESEGLEALIQRPDNLEGWQGPYINALVVDDWWGRPYLYRVDAEGRVTITSLGSDGAPGGVGLAADLVVTIGR